MAGAQHIDILVWDASGKVGVGEFDYDNRAASDNRVQIARFDEGYTIDSPGFTAFEGVDALPGNTALEWSFLPMTVDSGPHTGYRSTILYWDGSGDAVEFGPTASDAYKFSIFPLVGPGAAATGAAEKEPGKTVAETDAVGELHDHPFYFLDDGDGVNDTLPAAGMYVIGLEIVVADLEPSDPVYMVWATPEFSVLPAIRPAALWVYDRIDTLVVEPLAGDFNADGVVDAADYTVWRDGLGGDYDLGDYEQWRANFGAGQPEPALSSPPTSSPIASPPPTNATIPEPSALPTALLLLVSAASRRRLLPRGA